LARLPEAARGKVRQIDMKAAGIDDLGQIVPRGYGFAGYPGRPWVDLYLDGRPMQLARWPNDGFVQTGPVHRGRFRTDDAGEPGAFEYRDPRPERWQRPDDVWVFGYWGHLWAGRSVRIAEIDTEKRLLGIEQRSTYGYRENMPYYYFNVLEELDEPGEWYLDRASGIAYVWPPDESDDPIIEFPLLAEPLVRMTNVRHVTLRGLCFETGRTEGLVMTGGERNLLAGCTFRRFGANAVVVRGGSGHGILGCDLATLGAGGIRIAGGELKTLTPSGHFVENCHVRDFTRVDRVYAPAVVLEGVGGRIAHNLFHDSPHHAMRVEGFEHVIEWNEIHSVVYEADDQAGLDMWGDPFLRGIVIRNNFWHHIGSGHDVAGQSGIRLDDFISSVLMTGNVFYRASGGRFGGIQIHGGKDNIAENNLFIDCKYAISFSPWGARRWEEQLAGDRIQGLGRRGGIDIAAPPFSTRYPDLAHLTENPDRNFIWRNASVACGAFAVRDRGVNEWLNNVAFTADPGFADVQHRDFRLPPASPLYRRFGFRPIPFEHIGLYHDQYRAAWPVEHHVTPHFVDESPSAAGRE
ncbi:MAG: right-handed parallel beta-helix repeat-containing protein, partial [Thermoguttaceae bacterium]|nr:right-handed parallel beta-helix repeat-containing protein [Thermoguttaceae bacterium]